MHGVTMQAKTYLTEKPKISSPENYSYSHPFKQSFL